MGGARQAALGYVTIRSRKDPPIDGRAKEFGTLRQRPATDLIVLLCPAGCEILMMLLVLEIQPEEEVAARSHARTHSITRNWITATRLINACLESL